MTSRMSGRTTCVGDCVGAFFYFPLLLYGVQRNGFGGGGIVKGRLPPILGSTGEYCCCCSPFPFCVWARRFLGNISRTIISMYDVAE